MLVIIRRSVGFAVNVVGWLSRPAQIKRSPQELKLLTAEAKALRLYDYKGCPGSLKLRRVLHRLNVNIQYCDIRQCQVHQDDLLSQFGRIHAPCLRIEENDKVRWLDESGEIIHYLNQRFAPTPAQGVHA